VSRLAASSLTKLQRPQAEQKPKKREGGVGKGEDGLVLLGITRKSEVGTKEARFQVLARTGFPFQGGQNVGEKEERRKVLATLKEEGVFFLDDVPEGWIVFSVR
jgi:hypothetical protein